MTTLRQVCGLLFIAFAAHFGSAAMAHDVTIPDSFTEPDGWKWGRFTNAAGAAIRFGVLRAENPRATAVVVAGFREFGEKYFEVVRDLHDRNVDVWQMDWRGQGGSDHYLADSQKPWFQGYDRDADDLRQFTTEIVERHDGVPVFVVGHSMGGHIALRLLHDHPDTFDFAVLTAPMLRINTGGIPKWVAKPLAWGGDLIGGEGYVVGGKPWEYDHDFTVEKSDVSQDPVRFRMGEEYMRMNPTLRLGSATYGWLHNAFRAIGEINAESYLRAIATPVLIASPRNDQIVLPEAHDRACALMPACELFPIPGAKHEIWMERDDFRAPWLERVDAFVGLQLDRLKR
ncbi:MAG: alpha/beta hydrolase [Proteobacteria bacterium]|nr:alpha/beta hydrolase [Pseudomonadota bacterium]